MTFDEAIEARVTPKQAMRELFEHGANATLCDGRILVVDIDEDVIVIGKDGMVSGRAVLEWLGY